MNRALFPHIILVLMGASLFVTSRKSCLRFSYAAQSESESIRHSWKEEVLTSVKKTFSSKVLSDFSRSYPLISRSKGGHDKFVKITDTSFNCFTMPEASSYLIG